MEESNATVYHYTKLQSATGIICKDGIVFHAGRYDAMNDSEDSVYGAISTEKDLGHEVVYQIADPNTYNISPYIVSFCRNNDYPLMWRLYDAEIMLHIDSIAVMEYCKKFSTRMYLGNVDYVEEENVSRRVFELFAEANKSFANTDLEYIAKLKTTFIKVKDFECEQEWRIAWVDDYNTIDDAACPNKLIGDTIASEIKVKGTRYNALSYYRELKFPKECLKGITIRAYGDKEFEKIRVQLRLWLAQCGFDLMKVPIYKTKSHRVR